MSETNETRPKTAYPTRSAFRITRKIRGLLHFAAREDAPAWLCRGGDAYLVTQMSRQVLASLDPKQKIPYTEEKNGTPYAFVVSRSIAPGAGTEEMITALSHFSPDEEFLCLFPVLRAAAALCALWDNRHVPDIPAGLGQWMQQLHRTKDIDWDAVHDALSEVEKQLLCDPSGAYAESTRESKTAYRTAVREYAKRHHLTQEAAAKEILSLAENAADETAEIPRMRSLAAWLFEEPTDGRGAWVHAGLYLAAGLLSAAVLVWLLPAGLLWACLFAGFLFLPFYALVREGADIVSAHMAGKHPASASMPLLQKKFDAIPPEGKTLVITAALLTGGDHDRALIRNLERFSLRNPEKHLLFGLLADLPTADCETRAEDAAILRDASHMVERLNEKYGGKFILLVRRRRYAPGEGVYMGWERKRGAVLTLVKLLRGKADDGEFLETVIPPEEDLSTVQYILTLDSDTELPVGAVKEMVSVFLHPHNRPEIMNGCVRRGCAMLQPRMALSLAGGAASRLTLLCSGGGGVDPYYRTDADGETLLFGAGSFCGKGMFSVDAYLDVLGDAFPTNAVLSHDFLEGARLGCRNFPRVTLCDRMPADILSYFSRQERWVRGDVQALRFAFSRHRDAGGHVVKNPMPITERLRVIDHVLYALIPPAVVRCVLIASFFLSGWQTVIVWLLAFSSRILRPVLSLCSPRTWRSACRRFYGAALPFLRKSILWFGFRVQFTVYEGWVNLRAALTALWRMLVTHRHMLAWVTAGETEARAKKRRQTLSGMTAALWVSVLGGAVLLFSPSLFAKFIGVLWILSPVTALFLGRKPGNHQEIQTHDTAQLRTYAADIWRYFTDNVGKETCYLPPDNVQWFPHPKKTVAHRTSPTNIGLYLMCCAAACDLGLLSPRALYARFSDTLDTLDNMETYRGHYYNWYSTDNARPIGTPYISTVDSGNLACALLCAAGAADEYASEEAGLSSAATRMRNMAYRMEFGFLYREKKGQLSLGYDCKAGMLSESSYDLYASEARSAVYFAIAAGQIPADAWAHLARPVLSRHGRIGMLSWTGSAFEYFMPALWLGCPADSFGAEALSFAAAEQWRERISVLTDDGCVEVAGKSEGAYFAFDAEKNFQYQPCGTGALAICAGMDAQTLVMPYALFLMLGQREIPTEILLSDLRKCGMYGEYGFYEALDMTRARVGGGFAVVRSVMAHHLGMSMAAITNALYDGLFVRRFLADDRMEAAQILLWEQIPADAPPANVYRDAKLPENTLFARSRPAVSVPPVLTEPGGDTARGAFYAVLSNTHASVTASSSGQLYLSDGADAVTVPEQGITALPPLFFYLDTESKRVYAPFPMCADGGDAQFSFVCTDEEIRYTGAYADGTTVMLAISVSDRDTTFSFDCALSRAGNAVPFTLTYLFRPVLYPASAWSVHRTFADLFLVSAVDREKRLMSFTRRARGEGEHDRLLLLSAGGLDAMQAQTDAGALLPVGYTAEDVMQLGSTLSDDGAVSGKSASPRTSAVVPVVFVRGETNGRAVLHLQVRRQETGAVSVPADAHDAGRMAHLRAEHRMLSGGITPMNETVSALLAAIRENHGTHFYEAETLDVPITGRGRERFWKHGISGDKPIAAVTANEKESTALEHRLTEVLNAWKYLLISGIALDLVITVSETDHYGHPVSALVTRCIGAAGLGFFSGHGIFILSHADAQADGILASAVCVLDGEHSAPAENNTAPVVICPVKSPNAVVSYRMDAGQIVIEKGIQPSPWTYMLSNSVMGTLVSLDTLGFTFFTNARECRVTPWFGDVLSERCGEQLLLRIGEETAYYDLCRTSKTVVITPDEVHYLGILDGVHGVHGVHGVPLSFRVSVSIPDRRRRKRMRVFLQNDGKMPLTCVLRYQAEILLGAQREEGDVIRWSFERGEGAMTAFSAANDACHDYRARLSVEGCYDPVGGMASDAAAAGNSALFAAGALTVPPGEGRAADAVLEIVRRGQRAIPAGRSLAGNLLVPPKRLKPPVIVTGVPSLDALAQTWLPHQIVYVRMWGRCGFYQPGGAYGFRDQLQDAMAAAIFAPELLRAQIFRCAAHQYTAGDVQHWWHPLPLSDRAKSHRGIRSRCSDDYLWLPLATARYLTLTGDHTVLDREVRYLESPPLAEDESERYEAPLFSDLKEDLYMHCIRAIEHSFAVGEGAHGFPLMGIGDWNDGMNRVGSQGSGESVFCGMFRMLVLGAFLPVCRARGDEDGIRRYEAEIARMARAVEEEAWNGHWYRRAWYDDGTPMGNPGDPCAEIDILPQAFAAMLNRCVRLKNGAKPFDTERVHRAMNAAYEKMYDEKRSLFALLSPPFDKNHPFVGGVDGHNPGYIAGYIPGTRENGGQYTHAAVWGAMGLFAVGETEKGMRVLRGISPAAHTATPADILRYKREPWALCGDVLLAPGRAGEGGWSQYTGSAAWYYRLLYEVFGGNNDGGDGSDSGNHDNSNANTGNR